MCTDGKHLGSPVGLATVILVLLSCASGSGAFVMMGSTFYTRCVLVRVRVFPSDASCRSQGQGTPGSSARSASFICAGEGKVSEDDYYSRWQQ